MRSRRVKLIEQAPLALNERAELLLVYGDAKRAMMLELSGDSNYNRVTQTLEFTAGRINEITGLLDDLNLAYAKDEVQTRSPFVAYDSSGNRSRFAHAQMLLLSISRSRETVDALCTESRIGRFLVFLFDRAYTPKDSRATANVWLEQIVRLSPRLHDELRATYDRALHQQ